MNTPDTMRVSPLLTDHVIRFYFVTHTLAWEQRADWTLGAITERLDQQPEKNRWLPPEWREALTTRYADKPIWHLAAAGEDRKPRASDDLLNSVADLINDADRTRVRVYEFADNNVISTLFGGRGFWREDAPPEARAPRTLSLPLTEASRKRLASFHDCAGISGLDIGITLDSRLYQFRSGQSILDLGVTIRCVGGDGAPTAEALIEAVHELSGSATLTWRDRDGGSTRPGHTGFSLTQIARTLLEGCVRDCHTDARVYTCTYAQLAPGAARDDLKRAARLLAKHFSDDYMARRKAECVRLALFDNVEMAAAAEGAAIIVCNNRGIDFIANYRTEAFEQTYAPLALLARHEESALLDLSTQNAVWPGESEDTLERMRTARTKVFNLRSSFVFPRVSRIAAHEQWREALDTMLRLPQMRASLSDDLSTIEATLRDDEDRRRALEKEAAAKAEEQRKRRFAWMSVVAGGAVALTATFNVAKELLAPAFERDGVKSTLCLWPGCEARIGEAPFYALLIALAVASICAALLHHSLSPKGKLSSENS